MIVLNELTSQGFLACVAGRKVTIRPSGFLGYLEGCQLDPVCQVARESLELLEKNSFDLQVGLHRFGVIELGQAAPESQAIKARKDTDDIGLVLSYKGVWSVIGCGGMFVFHTNLLPT